MTKIKDSKYLDIDALLERGHDSKFKNARFVARSDETEIDQIRCGKETSLAGHLHLHRNDDRLCAPLMSTKERFSSKLINAE